MRQGMINPNDIRPGLTFETTTRTGATPVKILCPGKFPGTWVCVREDNGARLRDPRSAAELRAAKPRRERERPASGMHEIRAALTEALAKLDALERKAG